MVKNLILVLNNRRYNPQDFIDIGSRVARRAHDIDVTAVKAGSPNSLLSPSIWQRPTLTVAFSTVGAFQPLRGRLLIGRQIPKLEQLDMLRRAGVNVPRAEAFSLGMDLDPTLWGDLVLLKPTALEASSHGEGVQVFRTSKLRRMSKDGFPDTHPIHNHAMMVQEFVNTGEFPSKYRALILCGEPLYIQHTILNNSRPALNATDEALEAALVATGGGERTYHHGHYPDILAFAKRMAIAFPDIPLLGCDVVKDITTGKLYGLEGNPAGNVWHFSSRMWAERRKLLPEVAKAMHSQLGAFDIAAVALINATRSLAV